MKSKLLLLLFLPLITFSQTQLGENFTNPDENRIKPSKYGTGISISEDGTIAAVGAPGNNEDSFVRVYKYQNNTWEQLGNDIVNESILEKVGSSVSLSADGLTIAIGAVDGGNLDEGHIRIYKFIDNNWVKQGEDIVGDGTQFYLGYNVVLSPDAKFLAATAYRTNSSKKGTVKVYENISDVWTQRGTNLEGEFNYDAFGFTIDLSDDGNVLAIGNNQHFKLLLEVLKAQHLLQNKLFEDNQSRVINREILADKLAVYFKKDTKANLMRQFIENGTPAGSINNLKEVFEQEDAKNLILEEKRDGVLTKCVKTAVFKISD